MHREPYVLLQVEVLVVMQNQRSLSWRSAPDVDGVLYEYSPSNKELADHLNKCAPLYSNSSVARHSLTSVTEHPPRRESFSESLLKQTNLGTPLQGQLHQIEECSLAQKLQKPVDADRYGDDAGDSYSCQESTVSVPPKKVTRRTRTYSFVSLHNRLFLTAQRASGCKDRSCHSNWHGQNFSWNCRNICDRRIECEKSS
jgi:hypothetical protein